MRRLILFYTVFTGLCVTTHAARTSANYSVTTESTDVAGASLQSSNYSVHGSAIGEFGTAQSSLATSIAYSVKGGFVGQLYDLVGLSVTAPPSNSLNETATRQLNAAPLANDSTTLVSLNPATVNWSIVTGPISSISSNGLATAGNVYQNTLAIVGGSAQGLSGQLSLTILNVTTDDFGSYANDQIDDSWQVQYFGQPPNALAGPNADPDGTGQSNLFKFVAGLNPLDGSRFTLSILPVNGQSSHKNLVFSPIAVGRTYTPQFTGALNSPSWVTLTGTSQSDNGATRTVTDPNATPAPKFYRVQISKP